MRVRLLLVLIAALIPFGCDGGCGCGDDGALAELDEAKGSVERDTAAEKAQWEPAELESVFRAGEGLKTGDGSEALLTLTAGGKVRVGAETIIRFRNEAPGSKAQGLDVEMGDALLLAGEEPLTLATEVGTAVIEAGGAMRISRQPDGLAFTVTVGRARIERDETGAESLSEGESIEIDVGAAVVEDAPDASAAAEAGAEGGAAPLPATVVARVEGSGATARAGGHGDWKKLPQGEVTLEPDTHVRLLQGTTMSVAGAGQRAILRGAGQFVVLGGSGSLVEVRGGNATLSGSGRTVRVRAPGGTILTDGNAKADIAVKQGGATEIGVTRGAVRVEGKVDRGRLRAGETGRLKADGTFDVSGRGLDYADLVLSAGASAVIHDPRPPSAVGLIAEACPDGAVVELQHAGKTEARVRGGKRTALAIPAGRHEYSVHCVDNDGIEAAPAAGGNITVVADAGTAPLPRSAPTTNVAADGRKYTVLYQNLLPKIGISWSGAPSAPKYKLSVTSGGRKRTYTTTSPSFSFSSGALSEGSHQMVFTTDDGARSKTTTVQIRFDNAAPKASLTAPANRSFSPGQQVTVAGIALPGWKVTARGTPLPTDGQHRFRGRVAAPASEQSLAVLFSHPRRGTHYYLRRSSDAR